MLLEALPEPLWFLFGMIAIPVSIAVTVTVTDAVLLGAVEQD